MKFVVVITTPIKARVNYRVRSSICIIDRALNKIYEVKVRHTALC